MRDAPLCDMIMFLLYHFNIGRREGRNYAKYIGVTALLMAGYQWRIFINLSARLPISPASDMTQLQPNKLMCYITTITYDSVDHASAAISIQCFVSMKWYRT